ncbi:hypothetical protein V6N11_057906 [Hibiscus sabdariffa]|uniref:Uncharacterized protein n=1 Tax=Hibiscus sabdariffa TaxID=183260 RepID=A0ABR2P430_9ROSI
MDEFSWLIAAASQTTIDVFTLPSGSFGLLCTRQLGLCVQLFRLEWMDFKNCDWQDEEYGDLSYLNLPLKKTQSAYYQRDYDGLLAGNITEVESENGLSL